MPKLGPTFSPPSMFDDASGELSAVPVPVDLAPFAPPLAAATPAADDAEAFFLFEAESEGEAGGDER